MEPLLPPDGGKFEARAIELHRAAAALAATAHPITRAALARLVRIVNSYNSNLIEGVRTTPAEIDAALHADYSHDPSRAASQRLAVAHVEVELWVTTIPATGPAAQVTSAEFLRDIHRGLYKNVPAAERIVRASNGREETVVPGEFRAEDVTVGRHLAPSPASLPPLLERFQRGYDPGVLSEVQRIMAFAASHHRLLWIHPFLDGNGRVTRLFSVAYARRIGLDGGGLWSIARGFARYHTEYFAALRAADSGRRSDLDGRGDLSLQTLELWCDLVVRVALDQITYMRSLLSPETLADRLRAYAAYRAAQPPQDPDLRWRVEAGELLAALVNRGDMTRSDAQRMLPGAERTARAALATLLSDGILESDSHRSRVRLAFPPAAATILFPDLGAPPAGTSPYI